MQSTSGSRLRFDQILRTAVPDSSSPDNGVECSTADPDYSSDRSSTPSTPGKIVRKIVLTSAQAKDIFAIRPSMDSPDARAARGRISESARSRAVGARYGISAKTVRDIWNRVTWTAATEPLWTDQEVRCHIAARAAACGLDAAHAAATGADVGAAAALDRAFALSLLRRRRGRPRGSCPPARGAPGPAPHGAGLPAAGFAVR